MINKGKGKHYPHLLVDNFPQPVHRDYTEEVRCLVKPTNVCKERVLTASCGPSVAPSLADPRVPSLAVQLTVDDRVRHVQVTQAQVHVMIHQATCCQLVGRHVSCVRSEYVDTTLVHPDKNVTQLFGY